MAADEPDPSTRGAHGGGAAGGSRRAGTGGLSLHWRTLTPTGSLPRPRWVRGRLLAVCRALGLAGGQLSVAVVGDGQMADLHEQYRGDRTTTDVLSFDLSPPAPGSTRGSASGRAAAGTSARPGTAGGQARRPRHVDGELVLCLDEARRQAARRGHGVEVELLLYAVHGLLHLLGEDDADAGAAARMHRREDELLDAVGVGPVYYPAPKRNDRKAGAAEASADTGRGGFARGGRRGVGAPAGDRSRRKERTRH